MLVIGVRAGALPDRLLPGRRDVLEVVLRRGPAWAPRGLPSGWWGSSALRGAVVSICGIARTGTWFSPICRVHLGETGGVPGLDLGRDARLHNDELEKGGIPDEGFEPLTYGYDLRAGVR